VKPSETGENKMINPNDDFGPEIEIEIVDEWDGQPDEAQEWHDFDPDC
jgi:hypothetical protein